LFHVTHYPDSEPTRLCSMWHIILTLSQPDFIPCDTLSWLWASQTLFHVTHYPDSEPARLYSMWHIILTLSQPDVIHTPLNAVYLAEKKQIPILYSLGIEPTIYHTRVKDANNPRSTTLGSRTLTITPPRRSIYISQRPLKIYLSTKDHWYFKVS
jgi:hypothetical protein